MKIATLAGVGLGFLILFPAQRALCSPPPAAHEGAAAPAKNVSSAAASSKDAPPYPQVPRITVEEARQLMEKKPGVILVDTDDSLTYSAEHIRGAINIAYDPTVDAQDRGTVLAALPGDKLIVFYCNCPHEEDSAPLVLEMWQLGYDRDKVKALKGGLARWEQLGYPLAGSSQNSTAEQQKSKIPGRISHIDVQVTPSVVSSLLRGERV